jgi:hypothetical protein
LSLELPWIASAEEPGSRRSPSFHFQSEGQ